jgi:hypothetical protein
MFLMFTNGRDFFTFCNRHYFLPILCTWLIYPSNFTEKGEITQKTRGEASLKP